jgi:hypothetical protein
MVRRRPLRRSQLAGDSAVPASRVVQGSAGLCRRQIAATDKQIDRLVFELYGLSDEEIAIVEGGAGTCQTGRDGVE